MAKNKGFDDEIGIDDGGIEGEGEQLGGEGVLKPEVLKEVQAPENGPKGGSEGKTAKNGEVTGDGTYGSTFFTGYCNTCGLHVEDIQVGVTGDMHTWQCPSCGNTNTV